MSAYSVSRRRAIALLALTSLLLITLDLQGNSAVGGLRSIFGTLFNPVQIRLGSSLVRWKIYGAA